MSLTYNDKALLRLINKGFETESDGYAPVSKEVLPLLEKLPQELIEMWFDGKINYVKLSDEGRIVVKWLC